MPKKQSPCCLASCRFCKAHDFEKPNDKRGLDLMDACAMVSKTSKSAESLHKLLSRHLNCKLPQEVLNTFGDVRLGFGQSDEYSFVIHKSSSLYGETCLQVQAFAACNAIWLKSCLLKTNPQTFTLMQGTPACRFEKLSLMLPVDERTHILCKADEPPSWSH